MLYLIKSDVDDRVAEDLIPELTETEEALRTLKLVELVDRTLALLQEDRMTRVQAEALVETAKAGCLDLFPGSEATYNLLVGPRFVSAVNERFGREEGHAPARVLPFRRREAAGVPEVEAEPLVVELAATAE